MSEMIEHEAAETELSIDTTLERRGFLATPISSFLLRLASTLRAVGATQTVVREVTSMKKLIIPVLESVDAREKLFDHFGVEAEQFIGGSLEQALSHLVTKKAEQELPFVLEARGFERGEPRSWALLDAGHTRDIEGAIVQEAIQKEGAFDSRLGTRENWIRLLSEDRSVIENAYTALAECIIEEIFQRAKPKLQACVSKSMQRIELCSMHEQHVIEWIDVHACMFRAVSQMIDCEMKEGYEESCLRLLAKVLEKGEIESFVDHVCSDEARVKFTKFFEEQSSECILYARGHWARIKNLQKRIREDFSVNTASIKRVDEMQKAQEIAQSLQHPFQRVLSQISMLADPNYERTWEQPLPKQLHE